MTWQPNQPGSPTRTNEARKSERPRERPSPGPLAPIALPMTEGELPIERHSLRLGVRFSCWARITLRGGIPENLGVPPEKFTVC
jgi:hypothetical protein